MNKTEAVVVRAVYAINDRIGKNIVTERDIWSGFDPDKYLAYHRGNVGESAAHLADDFMKYHQDDISRW